MSPSTGISRWQGSFFLDLGEQQSLERGACVLALDIIVDETARLEDNGVVRPIRPSSRKARGGISRGSIGARPRPSRLHPDSIT
jgi:hypothetical protein